MPFDVMSYLRPRKQAQAVAISKLAEQLHRGESVDPDLILASLTKSGATEQQLQAEIDRLDRVARLRQQIDAAEPARKRLDAINSEIARAADKLEAAALDAQRVRQKYAVEINTTQATIEAGEHAQNGLMEPGNMSEAQKAEWQSIQTAVQQAGEVAAEARKALQHATERVADCEIQLPKAQELAAHNRNNSDIQDEVKRWENAKVARAKQLQEASAAMAKAEQDVSKALQAQKQFRATLLEAITK
jgi:chromosome segregation ATPase